MKHRRNDWEVFQSLPPQNQLIIVVTIIAIFLTGYVVGNIL